MTPRGFLLKRHLMCCIVCSFPLNPLGEYLKTTRQYRTEPQSARSRPPLRRSSYTAATHALATDATSGCMSSAEWAAYSRDEVGVDEEPAPIIGEVVDV